MGIDQLNPPPHPFDPSTNLRAQGKLNPLPPLGGEGRVRGGNEIEKAAKEFESFFVYYLLKVMRESIPKSGLLNPGVGGEIYTSIMDEKVAEGIANQGGLGLAHLLIKQMTGRQANKK